MTCDECRARLAGLPTESREVLPEGVREHLAQCTACASRLAALRLLLEEGERLRVEPSAALADSILARTAFTQERARPRRAVALWAPLAAAAAVALVVAIVAVGHLRGGASAPGAGVVTIHLTLDAPSAREVAVVGDWNGWNPKAQPLIERNGRWEIVLELPRGRYYQYQFLVDGDRWIPDPNALVKVANGFGGMNSILGS